MTVTGIITAIVFGLVIGLLARLVVPGKQDIPIWLTIIVGIVGAFIGTLITRLLHFNTTGFNIVETIIQIVVAAILVYLVAGIWSKRGVKH